MRSRTAWVILVLLVVVVAVALIRFNLSAMPEPGRLETRVANNARHFLVRRASRQGIPPPPQDRKASAATGDKLYGLDCGMCHGSDGRGQTDFGRWMYPRSADLTAADVQSYSDQELFWIVKNGIRFSAMPAFGKVESEEHIWNLVDYVRTLPGRLQQKGSSN